MYLDFIANISTVHHVFVIPGVRVLGRAAVNHLDTVFPVTTLAFVSLRGCVHSHSGSVLLEAVGPCSVAGLPSPGFGSHSGAFTCHYSPLGSPRPRPKDLLLCHHPTFLCCDVNTNSHLVL